MASVARQIARNRRGVVQGYKLVQTAVGLSMAWMLGTHSFFQNETHASISRSCHARQRVLAAPERRQRRCQNTLSADPSTTRQLCTSLPNVHTKRPLRRRFDTGYLRCSGLQAVVLLCVRRSDSVVPPQIP